MIFPFLSGFLSFSRVPLTWMLILTNFLIFFMTAPQQNRADQILEKKIRTADFLTTQGHIYMQYLKSQGDEMPWLKQKLVESALLGDEQKITIMGHLALRDYDFMQSGDQLNYTGDQVAIENWKHEFRELQKLNLDRPITLFGLSSVKPTWRNWITYQFMHASLTHLLSNMMVLLIFGGALELMIGSLPFILSYLLCGAVGALGFLTLTGLTTAPVIGASGAISGIMAMYAICEERKRIRFFYFLSPLKDYFGFIYLPTWLIFPLCLFSDVSAFISQPSEIGGVAYAAHIGGAIMGILLGLCLKYIPFRLPLHLPE